MRRPHDCLSEVFASAGKTALWVCLAWVAAAGPSRAGPISEAAGGNVGDDRTSAAAGVAAAAKPDAEPRARPDFSGRWVFNAKASDDPRQKVEQAIGAMQQGEGGSKGMGGGFGRQGPAGRKGGRGDARGSMAGPRERGAMSFAEISELTATSARLEIVHADPSLQISDDNGRRRQLYTDFRGASVSISETPKERLAVAGWEGAELVVETTLSGGTRLILRYAIDARTGQLTVVAAAKIAERQAVSYRLVYDRLAPETGRAGR